MEKAIGMMLCVITIVLLSGLLIGCAQTKIQPDGQGQYQAIMESNTFLGLGTDYAERVNGDMKVNRQTQIELDRAVEQYGGGETR